jgi:hypothetical protein
VIRSGLLPLPSRPGLRTDQSGDSRKLAWHWPYSAGLLRYMWRCFEARLHKTDNTHRTYSGPSWGRPSGPGIWGGTNLAFTAFSRKFGSNKVLRRLPTEPHAP